MTLLLSLIAGVFGAVIGSFLNVVIWRVPRGESVVTPPSACPTCGAPIRARDNVPVLSWLLLRARCRDCSAPISARYPLVEGGTAVAFGLVAWWSQVRFPLAGEPLEVVSAILVLVAFLWLAGVSIALALIDLDVHRLPNSIVYPTAAVLAVLLGTASALVGDWGALALAGIGAGGLGFVYLLLAFTVPGGMGLGDVKLAVALGLVLGWLGLGELVVGAFMPFLLGGVAGIALLVIRRGQRGIRIPFGPWMLAGAWIAIVAGGILSAAYLGIFGLV